MQKFSGNSKPMFDLAYFKNLKNNRKFGLKGGPEKKASFKICLLYFAPKPASDLQNSCVYPP